MDSEIQSNGGAQEAGRSSLHEVLADSTTWPYVLAFAKRMEAKLAKNRHKGDREGWLKDDPWSLVERILDETVEVKQCFTQGSDDRIDFKDAEALADECADVANFCMMVADCATTQESANSKLSGGENNPQAKNL
jgi:NTP pyrophosphatase (non-canonical NTP hydrolase)